MPADRPDVFFEVPVDRPMDPANESPSGWLERAGREGHFCCMCPKQTPPLPCCNAGHAEAVETYYAAEALGADDAR